MKAVIIEVFGGDIRFVYGFEREGWLLEEFVRANCWLEGRKSEEPGTSSSMYRVTEVSIKRSSKLD